MLVLLSVRWRSGELCNKKNEQRKLEQVLVRLKCSDEALCVVEFGTGGVVGLACLLQLRLQRCDALGERERNM